LLPYFADVTLAKLSSAMLRDTLDGLLALGADRHVLLGRAESDADMAAFDTCVHTPWEVLRDNEGALRDLLGSLHGQVVIAAPDAPSSATAPIEQALQAGATNAQAIALGRCQRDQWATLVLGASRGTEIAALVGQPSALPFSELGPADARTELPECHAVRELSDIDVLFEELKRHPERAPWTASFFVKMDWGG
jgi:hypothetical protein